jgi:hypothetical protein
VVQWYVGGAYVFMELFVAACRWQHLLAWSLLLQQLTVNDRYRCGAVGSSRRWVYRERWRTSNELLTERELKVVHQLAATAVFYVSRY